MVLASNSSSFVASVRRDLTADSPPSKPAGAEQLSPDFPEPFTADLYVGLKRLAALSLMSSATSPSQCAKRSMWNPRKLSNRFTPPETVSMKSPNLLDKSLMYSLRVSSAASRFAATSSLSSEDTEVFINRLSTEGMGKGMTGNCL